MKHEILNLKLGNMFNAWVLFEGLKFFFLFLAVVSLKYAYSFVWYWAILSAFAFIFSYLKTLKILKKFIHYSLLEENEELRILLSKSRNYLIFILILEWVPFLIFPQPILKFLYWRLQNIIRINYA